MAHPSPFLRPPPDSSQTNAQTMFYIVVRMVPDDDATPPDYTKQFDRARFFELFGEFGCVQNRRGGGGGS